MEPAAEAPEAGRAGDMAPLMKKILADYAATGLPPAFIPDDEDNDNEP